MCSCPRTTLHQLLHTGMKCPSLARNACHLASPSSHRGTKWSGKLAQDPRFPSKLAPPECRTPLLLLPSPPAPCPSWASSSAWRGCLNLCCWGVVHRAGPGPWGLCPVSPGASLSSGRTQCGSPSDRWRASPAPSPGAVWPLQRAALAKPSLAGRCPCPKWKRFGRVGRERLCG